MAIPRTYCVVFLFCVAAVIVSPAQGVYFTSMVSFDWTNGGYPWSGLVLGADGNFYGTTAGGGAYPEGCPNTSLNGCGTVFKISPAGQLTPLYDFCSLPYCEDGAIPYGQLIQASDGNLYGTTWQGGINHPNGCGGAGCGYGTVFKITTTGVLTMCCNQAIA
jgi:uncharacterized repeat protein (TIGR03803 family)